MAKDTSDKMITSHSVIRRSRSRMVVTAMAIVLLYGIVLLRMASLTMGQEDLINPKFYQPSQESLLGVLPEKADNRRANIYDRQGVLLASSLESWSVYADPKYVLDPIDAAKKISEIIPSLDYGFALKRLQSSHRFVWLKRHITPQKMYEINALGLPGIQFIEEEKRVYPHGPLMAHVVGYTDVDNKGMLGIEKSFDTLLSDDQHDIFLSLDVRVQHALRDQLAQTIKEFKAKGAAGIVMDIQTGEVLGMSSLPDFDPHNIGKSVLKNQFNRATMGVYELGSIFKVLTTAIALEQKNIRVRDSFDARKPLRRAGFSIRDFHPEKRKMNISEILLFSSNIGTALMVEKVGTEKFQRFLGELGLLDRLELEINELGKPLVPFPWRDINTLTASYGHGLAVSPLHAATAMAAMTNGGYYIRPTLLRRPKKNTVYKEQVISEKTSRIVNDMLRLVVTDGTGKNADAPGFRVGGKTGTAEKPGAKGYSQDRIISSFAAVFPADDPKYVVMTMFDEPVGNKRTAGYATAGWVAAPATANIVTAIGSFLNVRPAPDKDLDKKRRTYGLPLEGGKHLASY